VQNIFKRLSHNIRKMNKRRSVKLLAVLFLFVALPAVFGVLQKQQDLHQSAHAQTASSAATLWIYGLQANVGDDLATGWTGQVWYGGPNDINRFNTTTFYSGNHSLSWQDTAPNDEMDLYASAPFSISQYQYLTFYAQPTQAGQNYQMYLLNGFKQRIGNPVPIMQYGGALTVGQWIVYDIPISAFGANTTTISGIAFNDPAQGPQPPVYIDDIAFSVSKGENMGPSPLNATALPTQPPATPTPPYYPDISPWVYIIPGIIIFLAIFFE
jgi:hypothetical protein